MRFIPRLRSDFHLLLLRAVPLVVPAAGYATDYYVSPTGVNTNTGTSQGQAWQTIDRVNQLSYALQPGDRVLFQRGGVYRGELNIGSSGNTSQAITVGAYGSGAAPVISGSIPVSGWSVHQGNIWKAPVAQAVKYVFVNGQLMTQARFPNTGWLRNDNGSGTTLTDAALTQPNGYWTGATAVIRSTNWSYDAPVITGFTNGTLSFSNIWYNLSNNDWGYFLCNKLSELDMPGEWFYDQGNGQLYLWAPGSDNPNSLVVEGAVLDKGVILGWQKHHITVNGIAFNHQKFAAVRVDGATDVIVQNCVFQDTHKGIDSYGDNTTYTGNTFLRTYATAAWLIDDGCTFENNTLTDIAMVPGLGESNWGYFGVCLTGLGNIMRSNRLTNVGYIGMAGDKDCLVEKNVIDNATALLNDGGGISFDGTDGMICRDNIVMNITGDLESSAPNYINYEPIAHGIYFGNTSNTNILIQNNTVAHCTGAGIHVDHTMVATNIQVKDNVLFDNGIQLSISDYSNNVGPGATAPYFVANFNDVYTGNIMYAVTKDQWCMKIFNCYSNTPVDFGTFNNNRYFDPYEELSILEHNTYSGAGTHFTLETWQSDRNEDATSTRSALHLNAYEVTGVMGGNLIVNGDFAYNVTGWDGWPTNATVTHDYTYLDNGALKAYLPNGSQYPEFGLRNPDAFPMLDGQWYRLGFSLQSDAHGQVRAGVKGMTQMSSANMISERPYPFSTERRDIEYIFQGDLGDQAVAQFTNHYTTPTYWLDNVVLEKVQVVAADPFDKQTILINDQTTAQDFPITGCWSDVNGVLHSGLVNIGAYRSLVLVKEDDADCGLSTDVDDVQPADPTAAVVFPNPVDDGAMITVTTGLAGTMDARLLDLHGKAVGRWMITGERAELALSPDIAAGVYVLDLSGATGAIQQRVIVR